MKRSFVTIGTFDGVHKGHQKVIRRLLTLAKRKGWEPRVVMFEIPPRLHFHPHAVPRLLTTPDEREQVLLSMGVKGVRRLRFDSKIASQLPEDFFRDVLVHSMNAGGVLVGSDFCFGKDRSGTVETLERLCSERGLAFESEPLVCRGPAKVSSTRVRVLLDTGRVEKAKTLLGRPYAVAGKVVRGKGLGRKLGVPTANLKVPKEKLLPPGIFAARAFWDGKSRPAAVSIGVHPTTDADRRTKVEAHLIGFSGNLVGKTLRLELLKFLRAEKKFDSLDALKAQIAADIRRARSLA